MFGRKRKDDSGYQDNAALSGFGGYEPADGAKQPDPMRQHLTPQQLRQRPNRKRPNRRRALIMLPLAAVIALAIAYARSTPEPSKPDDTPKPSTPRTYQPEPRVVVPAVVDGWQSVASRDGSYAYDVPPSWRPAPTVVHGWEPGVTLATSAFLGKGSCPDDRSAAIGGAGVMSEKTGDATQAARKAVADVGLAAYTGKNARPAQVTPGPVEDAEVQLDGKRAPAKLMVAEVTPTGSDPCRPPKALVGAIALASGTNAVVLTVYSAQDNRDDLVRILHSYRGVPAADRSTSTPPPTTR
ncbi:hypothetical protein [Amycolatopsis jejuensis]|uniref:hypothetical protein n=1 Tax=Amycolatopsis jejuensis TaxID=330084 RepID=UPI000525A7F3|nr:hypothetical protein [Amycolatopsis jejuensis]